MNLVLSKTLEGWMKIAGRVNKFSIPTGTVFDDRESGTKVFLSSLCHMTSTPKISPRLEFEGWLDCVRELLRLPCKSPRPPFQVCFFNKLDGLHA